MSGQSKKVLVHLDMGGNQLLSAVVENVSSEPSTGYIGQLIYHDGTLKYCTSISPNITWTQLASGGSGTMNYNELNNKPTINNVTLSGNKTFDDLGLTAGVGVEITQSGNTTIISADTAFHAEVFSVLPEASAIYKNTVALIPKSGTDPQQYYQHMCTKDSAEGVTPEVWSWKLVGSTDISLANYYTKSEVDSALSNKQATITGAATTITSNNLTASKILASDSSGKVAVTTAATLTELGYLAGVSSGIQGQLNGKANASDLPQEASLTINKSDWTNTGHTDYYSATASHSFGVIPKSVELYDSNNNKVITSMTITSLDVTVYSNSQPSAAYTLKVIS